MKAIDPDELSAYLDGELDRERVLEIEAALNNDATLRAQLDDLASANRDWRVAARGAAFEPEVALAAAYPTSNWSWLAMALLALIVVRLAPKLGDLFEWSLILHAAALCTTLPWVIRMARSTEHR